MALYEVRRTDDVQPGEFVSALVLAGGTALARKAVAHHAGVTKSNVEARRVDTVKAEGILSVYFDEREPVADAPTLDDALYSAAFGPAE